MEKRPNANQITKCHDEEFDDRYDRIMLRVACLTFVVMALIMMAGGVVGLIWLIKLVFGC